MKAGGLGYLLGRRDKRLPVIHLTMVAACHHHHRGDVGPVLMQDVFETVVAVADRVGACCLYLEAAHEGLVGHYQGWGFKRVPGRGLAMYMPIATVRDALVPAANDDVTAVDTEAVA